MHAAARASADARDETRKILVVDDEAPIREIICAMLRNAGHKVETASEGGEALRLLGAHPFDVVFTDRMMPGIQGEALAQEIKRISPRIPVVMVSGSPFGDSEPAGIDVFIEKPFTSAVLREAVTVCGQLHAEGRIPVAPPIHLTAGYTSLGR